MGRTAVVNGEVVNLTPEEEAEIDAQEAAYAAGANARKAVEIREKRNSKLSKCDWTQVADAPVDKTAWATYRQALRDITTQSGFPWEITWPTQPGV
jgi:hypothetical protein